MSVTLHHVSLVTADPERSAEFYQTIFGLDRLDRPPFKIEGVWLGCGPSRQIHLTKHLPGNFRTKGVDNNDVHFAFRTDDFKGILARLKLAGYSEEAHEDSQKRMLVNRSGMSGFLQLSVMDPDRNIVEVNTAL